MTGVPERPHTRTEEPRLFRNNVIAAIVLLLMLSAGTVWSEFEVFAP